VFKLVTHVMVPEHIVLSEIPHTYKHVVVLMSTLQGIAHSRYITGLVDCRWSPDLETWDWSKQHNRSKIFSSKYRYFTAAAVTHHSVQCTASIQQPVLTSHPSASTWSPFICGTCWLYPWIQYAWKGTPCTYREHKINICSPTPTPTIIQH